MIISKRFIFSAGHSVPAAQDERERRLHGHNYVLHVGVSGQPDPATGYVTNLAGVKMAVLHALDRYDHRLLDKAVPPNIAGERGPTVEAVAEALWADLAPQFPGPVSLAWVRLMEDGGVGAEATEAGTQARATGVFAAAHRTHIPSYSDEANRELFGKCNNPAGHGHNYRVAVESSATAEAVASALGQALEEFDHRNLSADIADLAGRNVTTEGLARLLWERLDGVLPARGALRRVRLYELPDFFAEYAGEGNAAFLGRRYTFNAAHRLFSPHFSPAENRALYGKCGRADPHGHSYRAEVAVAGEIDDETGLLMNLADLDRLAGQEVFGSLDGRYLDEEVAGLKGIPTTGENVLSYLWAALEAHFGAKLARVRLWETRSNCFEMGR